MLWRRWNFLLWPFIAPLVLLLLYHVFATAWSNKCDPGNATFWLMKNDPVTRFHAPGQLFTWESDGPDNGYMCVAPTLSIDHIGPNVDEIFQAVRANMSDNGWSGGEILAPDQDFTAYAKTIDGLHVEASVKKDWFSVDVFITGPDSPHIGEFGFG